MVRTCALMIAVCLAGGCRKKEPASPARAQPAPKLAPVEKIAIPDPFGLGAVPTRAKPGDFVLCPPREWVETAIESGNPGSQTFIFYGAHMLEPGPAESKVRSLPGKEMMIPNSLIVPIEKGQTAEVGDILLTVWHSGSGMQRAIVVEGGTPTAPKVRYLDIELDNPTGAGQREDTCKPNTFQKLTEPWEAGTSVACKDSFGHTRWRIIRVKGERVLGLGFAGKMKLLPRKDCTPVPVKQVAVGGSVWVPHMGAYTEGKVMRVEAAIGRVLVEIELGGGKKEIAAPVVDVLTNRPGDQ